MGFYRACSTVSRVTGVPAVADAQSQSPGLSAFLFPLVSARLWSRAPRLNLSLASCRLFSNKNHGPLAQARQILAKPCSSLHLRVIAINFIAINYSSPLSLVLHTECFWKIYSKNIFSDYRGRKVCICLFDNFGRCVSQFRQLGTHTSTCAHVCTLSGNNIGDLKHCNNCRVEINWCSADVCLTIRLFFSR